MNTAKKKLYSIIAVLLTCMLMTVVFGATGCREDLYDIAESAYHGSDKQYRIAAMWIADNSTVNLRVYDEYRFRDILVESGVNYWSNMVYLNDRVWAFTTNSDGKVVYAVKINEGSVYPFSIDGSYGIFGFAEKDGSTVFLVNIDGNFLYRFNEQTQSWTQETKLDGNSYNKLFKASDGSGSYMVKYDENKIYTLTEEDTSVLTVPYYIFVDSVGGIFYSGNETQFKIGASEYSVSKMKSYAVIDNANIYGAVWSDAYGNIDLARFNGSNFLTVFASPIRTQTVSLAVYDAETLVVGVNGDPGEYNGLYLYNTISQSLQKIHDKPVYAVYTRRK